MADKNKPSKEDKKIVLLENDIKIIESNNILENIKMK